jgi:hypothetical protein
MQQNHRVSLVIQNCNGISSREEYYHRNSALVEKSIYLKDPLYAAASGVTSRTCLQIHVDDESSASNSDKEHAQVPPINSLTATPESLQLCEICYNDVLKDQLWNSKCLDQSRNYTVCHSCVIRFLEEEVTNGRVSEKGVQCFCRGCEYVFEETDFCSIIADVVIQDKFKKFRDSKIVQRDPSKHYCPNPSCSTVVSTSKSFNRAKCGDCKTVFCTACGVTHSVFLTCNMVCACLPSTIFYSNFIIIFRQLIQVFENGKVRLHKDANVAQSVVYLSRKMKVAIT